MTTDGAPCTIGDHLRSSEILVALVAAAGREKVGLATDVDHYVVVVVVVVG